MPSTYDKIATYTVPSSQASYTFSTISGSYTDLILETNYRSAGTGDTRCNIRVGNGSVDTGSNYSSTYLLGSGSSASSGRDSNRTFIDSYVNEAESTSSEFSLNIFQFMNYSNTTTNKIVLIRENTQSVGAGLQAGTSAQASLWRSTSAINTIQIYDATGKNIAAGSTFTLYGIKSA